MDDIGGGEGNNARPEMAKPSKTGRTQKASGLKVAGYPIFQTDGTVMFVLPGIP